MKTDSLREWLRPILGAGVLLAGAAGLAYTVISGYRHAATEGFVSVRDLNKLQAASAARPPVEARAVSADVAPPPQSTAGAAQTATLITAPPVATRDPSSAIADAEPPAETQENSGCAAIKTEQREIERASDKPHSPEESRYMNRRLRDLAGQSVKRKCPG